MAGKKRIAFLCHPYHRGGVTRWMGDAAIAADADGHEVYFITMEPVSEFFSAKGRETLLQLLGKEPNGIHIIKAKAGREFEFGTPQYRAYIYKKLIAQLPLGIPIILSDDAAIWDAATSLHDSYFIIGVLHADEPFYYNLAEKHARYLDALVCVSERVSKTAKSRMPAFDPGRIFTIPCGINLPVFNCDINTETVLQLVYVGRVSDYQKRTGDLLKICSLLSKKNAKFHLDIIGNGEAREALEKKCKESGLQECVTFRGWLSQDAVIRHLSESDVLVLTSDFEGTPVSMMEALAAGCGFVGTRVSGIEDYEQHTLAGDCFGVYAVGDIEGAVNKIMKIAAVPKNIRRNAARKMAESKFGMKECLEKYFSVTEQKKSSASPAPIQFSLFDMLYSKALTLARSLKVSFVSRK